MEKQNAPTHAQVFFTVQPVAQALARLMAASTPLPRPVEVPVSQALGRVICAAPTSPADLPAFVRSAMDGYAVRAADTFGASEGLPAYLRVVGHVTMGSAPDFRVGAGEAADIHTGGMLPPGADAVVIIERTHALPGGEIEVLAPVAPGENLVQIGEDVRRGNVILPTGHTLRPQDIGGLLAVGITRVSVAAPPKVALLGSGDELVPPEQTPGPGQVRDINSQTLAALFQAAGAETELLGIAADTFEALLSLAQQAFERADIVVLTAGSSVSTRDLTREVISQLGAPGVLQHGLAVKPGKPTILAACDGKPVIGLPGNPVSAFLVARQIVLPLIQAALGAPLEPARTQSATLTANIASTTGREDSVPVSLTRNDEAWLATPIFGKSNLIYTLVNAQGVVKVPLNSNGLKAGAVVDVELF
ncbi:MAG: molybdopterin molybdenumtransferase MoeA [Anaerolineae bacterium]|nr:molybdopterin molybdenumtransferase MoeA [Anaerolineae bacterium]